MLFSPCFFQRCSNPRGGRDASPFAFVGVNAATETKRPSLPSSGFDIPPVDTDGWRTNEPHLLSGRPVLHFYFNHIRRRSLLLQHFAHAIDSRSMVRTTPKIKDLDFHSFFLSGRGFVICSRTGQES